MVEETYVEAGVVLGDRKDSAVAEIYRPEGGYQAYPSFHTNGIGKSQDRLQLEFEVEIGRWVSRGSGGVLQSP
jgi:hypothetical protein